jgi:hypothetical protein
VHFLERLTSIWNLFRYVGDCVTGEFDIIEFLQKQSMHLRSNRYEGVRDRQV